MCFKSLVRSKMEYGGGLLAAWMIANGANNRNPSQLPTPIGALSALTDRAACWILKLPISNRPGCPGGSGLLRSIAGLPHFIHRSWELAAFFMNHIHSSRADHPIRTFMFDPEDHPPWHDRKLPPRLHRSPIWTRWSTYLKQTHDAEQQNAVRAVRQGQTRCPSTPKLSLQRFVRNQRQGFLDSDGRLHLAGRIRGPSRVREGGFDCILLVQDPMLRQVLIRWRRGVWGLGSVCTKCGEGFMPSHVARCGLLDDAFRPFLAAAEDLRLALTVEGVCADVLSGVGVVEAAIVARKWNSVREMFVELASTFGGGVAWDGSLSLV